MLRNDDAQTNTKAKVDSTPHMIANVWVQLNTTCVAFA